MHIWQLAASPAPQESFGVHAGILTIEMLCWCWYSLLCTDAIFGSKSDSYQKSEDAEQLSVENGNSWTFVRNEKFEYLQLVLKTQVRYLPKGHVHSR
jgi:hypothetical protein